MMSWRINVKEKTPEDWLVEAHSHLAECLVRSANDFDFQALARGLR